MNAPHDDLDPARGLIWAMLAGTLLLILIGVLVTLPGARLGFGLGLVFCGGYALGRWRK